MKVEKENTSLKRQKVFLLNTHLYGLMNEAELHIQRLCIILDIFIHKNFDYPEKPLKYKHIRRISD